MTLPTHPDAKEDSPPEEGTTTTAAVADAAAKPDDDNDGDDNIPRGSSRLSKEQQAQIKGNRLSFSADDDEKVGLLDIIDDGDFKSNDIIKLSPPEGTTTAAAATADDLTLESGDRLQSKPPPQAKPNDDDNNNPNSRGIEVKEYDDEKVGLLDSTTTTTTAAAGDDGEHQKSLHLDELKNDEDDEVKRSLFLFFLPVEPVPIMTLLLLTIAAAVPALAYIVFFTKLGIGEKEFYRTAQHHEVDTKYVIYIWGSLMFVLYLFDYSYWGRLGFLGRVLQGFFAFVELIMFTLVILFEAQDYPYGPICLIAILTPVWMLGIKAVGCRRTDFKTYVTWLTTPLWLVSVSVGITWFVWVCLGVENHWNNFNQAADAPGVGCEPDFDAYPNCVNPTTEGATPCFTVWKNNTAYFPPGCKHECIDVYDKCLNTFIVWVGPLLLSVLFFFMSVFCTFLRAKSLEKQVSNFVKLWLFLLFVMWCSASLVGAGDGISSAIAAFTITAFVGSFAFLASSFSYEQSKTQVTSMTDTIIEKYSSYFIYMKGLLVVTCSPVAVVYIFMSFLNQTVRKCNCFCSKKLSSPEDRSGLVTKRCRKQIEEFKSWEHTEVFVMAIYWGIGFMVMQVLVQQFTTLFLSWLIDATASLNIGLVTFIMFAVGIIMFMLPPVPGAPIYLTFGTVVVGTGTEPLGGIFNAILYCNVVCLLMKLVACALQQKGIGETLSENISVRKMCQVNSNLIRTMKLILSEPGLTTAKVAILVGGPDWPTSVLCGILKLNLVQVLIGTVPVILLVTPTVLAGSFTYMGGQKNSDGTLVYPWATTAAAVCMSMIALVMFVMTTLAISYVDKTARERADELEQMPYDEEVKKLEIEDEKAGKVYKRVTRWEVLPMWAKVDILVSLTLISIACYLVFLKQDDCFVAYGLTSTIEKDLGGKWYHLVKYPLGLIVIVFFSLSWLLLIVFSSWAGNQTKEAMESQDFDDIPEDEPLVPAANGKESIHVEDVPGSYA